MDRAEFGRKGEAAAAQYYFRQGYVLVAHGYRTRMGELDLVLDGHGLLVIAEVKARGQAPLVQGCEAVGPQKRRRIILATQHFLCCHPQYGDRPVRFDVLEVTQAPGGLRVHCIPAAFEC